MNPTFLPANITHYPISTNPIPTKKNDTARKTKVTGDFSRYARVIIIKLINIKNILNICMFK